MDLSKVTFLTDPHLRTDYLKYGYLNKSRATMATDTHPAITRILIADSYEVVRSGLRRVLDAQPCWEVVAEAGEAKLTPPNLT
jgi:hypothetical protein